MADPIVLVQDLVYEYPDKRALHGVSCQIERGSITAMVGPNGAGKTTMLRCLAALDDPFSGRVVIDGLETTRDPRAVHHRLGYLADLFGLYDDLSVARCLQHAAAMHNLPAADIPGRVKETAAQLGLDDRLDQKAGTLSRGLRQRLAIAQTIIHRPSLLLLDEPASGLDPEARQSLSALMLTLRDQGMTLIVSSHILAELEDYSTHLLIMDGGHILEYGPISGSSLTTSASASHKEPIPLKVTLSCEDERLHQVLMSAPGVEAVDGDFREATVFFLGETGQRHDIIRRLVEASVPVIGFEEIRTSLQDSYLRKVKAGRDQRKGR